MVSRALLVALLLCVVSMAVVVAQVSDEEYVQDYSFRSVFKLHERKGTSLAWEHLDFPPNRHSANQKVVSSQCILSLQDGTFFGAARKAPVPSLESLENPFEAWQSVGSAAADLGGANIMIDTQRPSFSLAGANSSAFSSVYVLTKDNIVLVNFEGKGCGDISHMETMLSTPFEWGEVNAIDLSASRDLLFIASKQHGALSVKMGSSTREVKKVRGADLEQSGEVVYLRWVEQWNSLFLSTPLALWRLAYSERAEAEDMVTDSEHEWIGGVLGYPVTGIDYDAANDYVWMVEAESLHKLSREGQYYRYGWQQGAPMTNVSTVAIADGYVWVGSWALGLARMKATNSPDQLDASIGQDGNVGAGAANKDPWAWDYYWGARWMPSNDVSGILFDSKAATGHSVLVTTGTGIAYIRADLITLAKKAKAVSTFQHPRHDRHGLISPVTLDRFGDLSSFHYTTNDNDGLWTSQGAMGLAYRYAHSLKDGGNGDEEARALAWNAFEALEHLSLVTGGYPHYTARTMCKVSDGDYGCTPPDPECWYECWRDSPTEEGWQLKTDTSSDEMCGHLAAYPILYDLVAQSDKEKARVLKLYDGILGGIVDNDLYLIDPWTGNRTFYGFWNPKEINREVEHYSERGPNSLQILSWLTAGYSITGKEKYRKTFEALVSEHHYDRNARNCKIDSDIDENHGDTLLIMEAYHAGFWALQRLDATHPRRKTVHDMLQKIVPSLEKTFMLARGELCAMWLGIYAGTADQLGHGANQDDIVKAVWSLRHYPMDFIEWEMKGSQRQDEDIKAGSRARDVNTPIMRHIRPPTERKAGGPADDPFMVDPGGTGTLEYDATAFLLQYNIMLYNGLII